ncbi:hypothetical protein HYU18_03730 [Candidatus Woesearchaeota archaeon]|nr:hypothetical protein [Candidatus Woesearchaeota archaeon]
MTYQFTLHGGDIDAEARILTAHLMERGFSIGAVVEDMSGRDVIHIWYDSLHVRDGERRDFIGEFNIPTGVLTVVNYHGLPQAAREKVNDLLDLYELQRPSTETMKL